MPEWEKAAVDGPVRVQIPANRHTDFWDLPRYVDHTTESAVGWYCDHGYTSARDPTLYGDLEQEFRDTEPTDEYGEPVGPDHDDYGYLLDEFARDEIDNRIDRIKELMRPLRLPGPIYRGTKLHARLVRGDVVELDSLTSASWSPYIAGSFQGDTMLEIRGSPELVGLVTNEDEEEVILAPGQRFLVTAAQSDANIAVEDTSGVYEDGWVPARDRQFAVLERIPDAIIAPKQTTRI